MQVSTPKNPTELKANTELNICVIFWLQKYPAPNLAPNNGWQSVTETFNGDFRMFTSVPKYQTTEDSS